MARALAGRRIHVGERVIGVVHSSAAFNVFASFKGVFDDGSPLVGRVFNASTPADRTQALMVGHGPLTKPGTITDLTVLFSGTAPKRGQCYVQILTDRGGAGVEDLAGVLAQGYLYGGHAVPLDEDVEPGPGGGEGFLSWVTVGADIAGNVASTLTLGVTNTLRKYRAFMLMYNSSADAASRTIAVRLIGPSSGAVPTGLAGRPLVYATPTVLTLTASEEGSIYVSGDAQGGFEVTNDAGGITVLNNSANPNPFPYAAVEDDLGTLGTNIGAGEAADRYSMFALVEEWLVL